MTSKSLTRRKVLRGMLQGASVSVSLPFLDVFLNSNATALADGGRLPTCFGTWFWGLGLDPGLWEPKTTGADYELRGQMKVFEPIQDKINIYSGMQVFLDGKVNQNHYGAAQGMMTGYVSGTFSDYRRSLDEIIADKLNVRTRFRSINVACDGNPNSTWSARGTSGMNPSEISPIVLYERIFGAGFADPNAAEFTPDPEVMLRKSVLSAVTDERRELVKKVGTGDRVRLDEFYTSVRDLEQKLALELEKPAPMRACSVPAAPEGENVGIRIDDAINTHNLFAGLLSHALACGQTRIINVVLSPGASNLKRPGDPTDNHVHTHEERIDPEFGYQPISHWFGLQHMTAFTYFVQALDSIKEGDGSLLDRVLIFAFTEHGEARLHSMKKFPLMTAGGAGGGMGNGYHVNAEGDACTRVGLTCQQALGLSAASFGTESNEVSDAFFEVLT